MFKASRLANFFKMKNSLISLIFIIREDVFGYLIVLQLKNFQLIKKLQSLQTLNFIILKVNRFGLSIPQKWFYRTNACVSINYMLNIGILSFCCCKYVLMLCTRRSVSLFFQISEIF